MEGHPLQGDADMANDLPRPLSEAATLRSMMATMLELAQLAEDTGDRSSAAILVNVVSLLAELQVARPTALAVVPRAVYA